MSFVNVIPGGVAGTGAPPPGNDFESVLTSINGSHFWQLNEANPESTGFVDSIGSLDLAISGGTANERGQYNIIGPFRGTPRIGAMCFERGGLAANVATADGFTDSDGAIGGWFALGGVDSNSASDWHLMSGIYNNNAGFGWRLTVRQDGVVSFLMDHNSPSAEWFYNQAGVTGAFKRESGDTNLSGNKWAFIAIIQRGDGTGPKLFVNGTEYAYTSKVDGFSALSDDTWFAETNTALTGFGTHQFRIHDTRAFTGYSANAHMQASAVFFIDAAPSVQDIVDLYEASNLTGPATDYLEYVRGIEPTMWMAHDSPSSSTLANEEVFHWCPNILDEAAGGASNWFGGRTSASGADRVSYPSAFSGIGYNKRGIQLSTTSFVGEVSYDASQASSFTNANGFTQGSIVLLLELAAGSGTQLIFSLRGGSGGADRGFDIGFDYTGNHIFLEVFTDSLKNNSYRIELDRPAANGVPFMLVFVNNGVDVTTYVNGVEQDGMNITTNLNGTFDGSEWLGEPGTAGSLSGWGLGSQGGSASTNRFGGIVYDFFSTLHVLTNSQQASLYDLLTGNTDRAVIP